VGNHRHMPEIEQTLTAILGRKVEILFQPHLCPMDRGMLCSIYATPARGTERNRADRGAPGRLRQGALRPRAEGGPAGDQVRHGHELLRRGRPLAKGKVVLFSALDNLVKGASGQAIQNMNLMFGLEETTGLF